jgi:hypothetical protein
VVATLADRLEVGLESPPFELELLDVSPGEVVEALTVDVVDPLEDDVGGWDSDSIVEDELLVDDDRLSGAEESEPRVDWEAPVLIIDQKPAVNVIEELPRSVGLVELLVLRLRDGDGKLEDRVVGYLWEYELVEWL